MQNRGSESKTIKCYSRPSEITGEYINFQNKEACELLWLSYEQTSFVGTIELSKILP